MLTLASILGWSLGIGITLSAGVALIEWYGRRADRRDREATDLARARLDGFVATRPSVWQSPPGPPRRRTNGTRQP
jgi:hypothetical protein